MCVFNGRQHCVIELVEGEQGAAPRVVLKDRRYVCVRMMV